MKKRVTAYIIAIIAVSVGLSSAYMYLTASQTGYTKTASSSNSTAIDFVNDTVKASNLTTVVERQFIDKKINSLVVEFNYTTSEQGLGIDYFQCTIDNKEYGECSSPFVLQLKGENMSKTRHTLEIRAIDMKGNVEQTPAAILFLW